MVWNWRAAHAKTLISADEAAGLVKSGDHIVFSMASPPMTPVAVVQALARRASELRDVSVEATFTAAGALGILGPGTAPSFRTTTAFASSEPESVALVGLDPQVGYVPMNPSFIGTLTGHPFREHLTRRFTGADVYVVTVTPPSAAGFVTFGTNLWNSRAQARRAKIVIGEVREDLPITPGGDNWMPVEAFHYLVETKPLQLPAMFNETPEEEIGPSEVCGAYTAGLINNGDTVMFGGGAMPMRLAPSLQDKEDLGCHSEVICPIDLVQKGVINNKKRNLVPGKVSVTGLIPRTDAELAWFDGNPLFDLRDMERNNSPKYIAQNDNLVAVNAPLEITLWGEIGIERLGPRYFRGVGGQVEFIMGALLSHGGRSIHAVVSRKKTAGGEWVSAIVPEFTRPGVASVPRQLADFVVTEYGVASLMGKTERERAEELISIAHPDFRPGLREAGKRAFGLDSRTFVPGTSRVN